MFRKLVVALVGVALFAVAGLVRASLFHEIYFFSDATFTAGSLTDDGPIVQNDLQPAAIGTLTLDVSAEDEGGFSCDGNCGDLAILEITVQQPDVIQPDSIVSINNAQPPGSITYTAEVVAIDTAQVFSDWALLLNNLSFTIATMGLDDASLLNLSPAPGLNTNGGMVVIPSTGTCDGFGSFGSFCGAIGFGRPIQVQSMPVHGVPEPSTLALLSLGLAGLGFTRRRMKA